MSKGVTEKVMIKLYPDQNARPLDFNEIIHPKEFRLALHLIDQSLKKIEHSRIIGQDFDPGHKSNESFDLQRYHDTIVVSGSRGTGKTTFILSLLKEINSRYNRDIEILPIFDPTLIEDKAHLFVNILSKIYNAVINSSCQSRICTERDQRNESFENWESHFYSLAEGLPILDGVGSATFSSSDWDDPRYIIVEGVRKTNAANKLERNFHEFISSSLRILKKKAFLICFDDIDTNFVKGWPVLEVLRKYLTTPQIISVLSGDFELYSAIVRKKQWGNLEVRLSEGETRRELTKFKDLVSLLENQYLLKLLRPGRRVSLNSVYTNNLVKNAEYMIVEKSDDKFLEIFDFYKKHLFDQYSIISDVEQDVDFKFVSSLPIRSQIQLMQAISMDNETEARDLFNVFWSNWNETNTSFALLFDRPDMVPLIIIRFLLDNKILSDGYYLFPNQTSNSLNGALFAAGIYFQSLTRQRRYFIFDHLIRTVISREAGSLLPPDDGSNNQELNYAHFLEHCKITSSTNLQEIAGYYNSFFYSRKTGQQKVQLGALGSVELRSLYLIRQKKAQNQIDLVLEESGEALVYYTGLLPISIVADKKGYKLPKYSVINLLAAIGELLKWSQSKQTPRHDELLSQLIDRSSIRAYHIPKTDSNFALQNVPINYSEDSKYREMNFDSLNEFISLLNIWLTQDFGSHKRTPSPYLLANIGARFFENLETLQKKKYGSLGKWMHLVVSSYLNSALIEESLIKSWKPETNRVAIRTLNIQNSIRFFVNNLRAALLVPENYPFSLWLINCPLLSVFIDTDDEEFSSIDKSNPKLSNLFNSSRELFTTLSNIQYTGKDDKNQESLPSE